MLGSHAKMQLARSLEPGRNLGTLENDAGIEITDPRQAQGRLHMNWAAGYLNDARDVVFVRLMLECTVTAGVGVALWVSSLPLVFVGPLYWAGLLIWTLDRFTLMLHCTSHRQLFKPRYKSLNRVIPWLLGPFFGQTPNTYFAHHLAMHHREENLMGDLSATLRFRRDRLDHWLRYYLRFLFCGIFELSRYFARRRQFKLLTQVLVGEGVYWGLLLLLASLQPARTIAVFLVPLLLVRTLMMIGNWGQHAFVCARYPEDPYRASITCINTRYNRRCFNDGYHVLHHVKPRCHWSCHPAEFERDLPEYGKHDSIVFDGLDFFQVWVCLMFRRWNVLAAHFVRLPGAPQRSSEDVIALLRKRVKPILTAPTPATGGALKPSASASS